jgi:steroid delta-isomerase-like uncharacterized protein
MAEQDLIKVARGLVDAFNRGDWEGCRAALAADSLYDEVGTSRRLQGVAQTIQCLQGWKGAWPDVKGTVNNAFATGNTAVLEITWQGTHTGPLPLPSGTLPATGNQFTIRTGWLCDFDGGRIKESRHYFDMLSLMQQIGALSALSASQP